MSHVTMGIMKSALVRWVGPLLLVSATVCGQQYKADKAGPLPPEVPSSVAQVLEKNGFQITNNGAKYCEVWFRAELPGAAAASKEPNVTLPTIPVGTLVGVIRLDEIGRAHV